MAKSDSKPSVDAKPIPTKKTKNAHKPAGATKGGLAAPVTPSADLAEIVGNHDLPRSEVVSRIWAYIKQHKLQDETDKRKINADEKLAKVFGQKSATMFEMNKLLSPHLTRPK